MFNTHMHPCVKVVLVHFLSLLTTQHVIHVIRENLVLFLHLEFARIAMQVGTRIRMGVSNAKNALRDSRKN